MRDYMPRFAQRVTHQLFVVAPHECPIVFSTQQYIAPAAKHGSTLVDATGSVDVRDIFQNLNALGMPQHGQCCIREKFGDSTDGGCGENCVADTGDIDEQNAPGFLCLLRTN